MKKWFGIIVEGYSDEEALRELLQKCMPKTEEVECIVRPCGGISKLKELFPKFLEGFKYEGENGKPVDKALIVRDADNKDPDMLKKDIFKKIENRTYPFPVCPIIAKNELEAWLLADESALERVTSKSIKQTKEPEALPNAKERLKQILVPYDAAQLRRVAEAINVQILLKRCPSFKFFHDVANCVVTQCKVPM